MNQHLEITKVALKVYRSTITKELDPDWGSITPNTKVEGYVVNVTTSDDNSEPDYWFVTLLPECENDEDARDIVTEALALFLEDGDEYSVRGLTEDDVDLYVNDSVPLLGFNSDTLTDTSIEFFWMVPPKSLMN